MIRFILMFILLSPALAFAESDEYGHEIEPSPSSVDQLVLANSPFIIAGGSFGFSINWRYIVTGYMPQKAWMNMMIDTDPAYVALVNDPTPCKCYEQKKRQLRAILDGNYRLLWKTKMQLWEAYTRKPYKEGKKLKKIKLKLEIPF